MHVLRVLLLILLAASFVVAQDVSSPPTDDDWQREIDLYNQFLSEGDYPGAYEHAQASLDIAIRKKLDTRSLAASKYALAEVLNHEHKSAEAEPLAGESLKLRESVLPPTHFRVIQSVDLLGYILYDENKYDEAEPLRERAAAALATMDRDGPLECMYGEALNELGAIALWRGNNEKAEGLLVQAVRSLQTVGPGCGQLHDVFENLANAYSVKDEKAKQEQLWKAAVEFFTPEEGDRIDYHYVVAIDRLAMTYVSEKRYTEAEPLFKQAIDLAPQVRGVTDRASPDLLASVLTDYKSFLIATGRKEDVAALESRLDSATRNSAEQARTPETKWTALMMQAMQALQRGNRSEGEEALKQSITIAQTLSRESHHLVDSYLRLASVYEHFQDWKDASALLDTAQADIEKRYGKDSPEMADMLTGRTVLCIAQGDTANGIPVAEAAVKMRRSLPDVDEMMLAGELNNLGGLYTSAGRYKEALPTLQEALELEKKTDGDKDGRISSTFYALGILYKSTQNYAQSVSMFESVVQECAQVFGGDNPCMIAPLEQLTDVYRLAGRPEDAKTAEARRAAIKAKLPE